MRPHDVTPGVRTHVERVLADAEEVHGARIIVAVESGSRAWGFPSPDSDYDVRFVYVRRRDDYLTLRRRPDTIGLPVDDTWDVAGWDVGKALALAVRGNATPVEWLASPIWYRGTGSAPTELFRDAVLALTPVGPLCSHHRHVTANNLDAYRETGRAKKFLYALRGAATCRWIERHVEPTAAGAVGRLVPIDLFTLLAGAADRSVIDAATVLVAAKTSVREAGTLPIAEVLEDYITEALAAGEGREAPRWSEDRQAAWTRADEAFRAIVDAAAP